MEAQESSPAVYRYFFFGWLFHDVGRGSPAERRAAWRHNLAQARWLPTYLRRWLTLSALLFSVGVGAETIGGVWSGAACFVLFASAMPVVSVIIVAMLGFRYLPSP
jgi:hypothetical protein